MLQTTWCRRFRPTVQSRRCGHWRGTTWTSVNCVFLHCMWRYACTASTTCWPLLTDSTRTTMASLIRWSRTRTWRDSTRTWRLLTMSCSRLCSTGGSGLQALFCWSFLLYAFGAVMIWCLQSISSSNSASISYIYMWCIAKLNVTRLWASCGVPVFHSAFASTKFTLIDDKDSGVLRHWSGSLSGNLTHAIWNASPMPCYYVSVLPRAN